MLKTLRVTSFIAIVLAVCGTAAMFFMGLKGDPEVKAFLERPGVAERFKGHSKKSSEKGDKTSPLVAQAHEFALRIDPPPPPKPPEPKKDTTVKPVAATARPKPEPPKPKVQTTRYYDVLATVVYTSSPERSLALLGTTGNKQEWFRQGEKAGHLEIQEIRDGSVVFTQGGRNPEEKFVPAKPVTKSLLKKDQGVTAVRPTGSGRIGTQLPISTGGLANTASLQTGDKTETGDSNNPAIRSINRGSRSRADISGRIQRIRSAPIQPESSVSAESPREQKKILDETMTGIEEIMNRQDESLSKEEREQENEMWMELIETLKTEKESLEQAVEAKDDPKDEASKEEAKTEPPTEKASDAEADDKGEDETSDPNTSE